MPIVNAGLSCLVYNHTTMWNVRMRASRRLRHDGVGDDEIHISGAESLCGENDCGKTVSGFVRRALSHSRGRPDRVVITAERLSGKPDRRPLLPFATASCSSTAGAEETVRAVLRKAGVSGRAVGAAIHIVTSGGMRGASLVNAATGRRIEPDRARGVRVSRLGLERESLLPLSRRLSRAGINSTRVREALIVASKVASCEGIVAELCISDDPDYTTGYIASRDLGYLRIPHMKAPGAMYGGRVFFVDGGVSLSAVISYLEKTAVLLFLPAAAGPRRSGQAERPGSGSP